MSISMARSGRGHPAGGMLTLDLGGGLDLLELNVVALVGLDAPADRRSLPGHLAVAAQGQVEDLGDLEHGVAEQLPVLLMVPALGHDLQVAPVEGHPDRAAFWQAVDPGLVDRPVARRGRPVASSRRGLVVPARWVQECLSSR